MLTGKTCRITGSQRFLNLWVNERYSHIQNTKWCVSCLKNGEQIRALIVAYGYEDINEIQVDPLTFNKTVFTHSQ